MTALGFGFRHGVDWDHIAAITDIAGSQETRRRSMYFATLYALGHGLVVFVLGFIAIALAQTLPASFDASMERIVGITLILLGTYVIYGLIRHGRDFRMRSRWMLVFGGIHRGFLWARARLAREGSGFEIEHAHEHHVYDVHHHEVQLEGLQSNESNVLLDADASSEHPPSEVTHSHHHHHRVSISGDPFMRYGTFSSFAIGMIHGIGAETPSQVLIFVTAAGAGGTTVGVLLLLAFLAGLLAANSLIAIATTLGFVQASKNFPVYAAVSSLTAVFSLIIGVMFLLGKGTLLPAMFAG